MIPEFSSQTNGVDRRVSNAHLQKPVAEIIANGFFTVDRTWTVTYWNKEAEKLLGIPAHEIIGKNLWKVRPGFLPVKFYAVYRKAFQSNNPFHFEDFWGEMAPWSDVITYDSGDTLSVSFKASGHHHASQYPESLMHQLEVLNELYRVVTEVTNDCLWERDLLSNEIFWIDGGHKRVFGYQIVNALIPRNFWENHLHPDDKIRVLESLAKIISEGTSAKWEEEYRFRKADGNYAYVQDRGCIIYDANNIACRMIGATKDISEKVFLEIKLSEERLARQREITHAVLTALENEREDIGRKLYDNLGQLLALAKLYLQMARKDEEKSEMYMEKSGVLIENCMNEISKLAKTLVIPGTDIIGLFDNIENLLHDLSAVHSLKIEFYRHAITENSLDRKLQTTIFRIVQEQLNNIIKHANAARAVIDLNKQGDQVTMTISDDGQGCDLAKEKNGVGILNIKSRVELLNGKVAIISKPGEGFEMKIVFPVGGQG